jgi:cyclopropane fatty-acyl-phospholipid synthase-like methyltransferase
MGHKSIFNIIPFIFFIVLIIQLFITYSYTNTKRFSIIALIRNSVFVIFIYLFINTKNILYLALPFLIEIGLSLLKYRGYQLDKYIATEYLYSDYFRKIVKENALYSNFSEGIYDEIFGLDTLDHTPENLKIILDWTKNTYTNAYKNKTHTIKGINGKTFENINEVKKYGEVNKFKKICDICKINKDMKILEIGFGECDFMDYIKKTYGINVVGVSISKEQVILAKQKGFEAYHLNMWDITDKIGKFDLIIQCGNLEYVRCASESEEKYSEYFNIIQRILNIKGKYFITCIHQCDNMIQKCNFYDWIKLYILVFGNDGSYPAGRFCLTKLGETAKMKNIYQEERTNDYFIQEVFFMSSYGFTKKGNNQSNPIGILDAIIKTIAAPYYIHSYLCYSPTKDFYWLPWLWEFIPRQRGKWFGQLVSLEYILFQNNE